MFKMVDFMFTNLHYYRHIHRWTAQEHNAFGGMKVINCWAARMWWSTATRLWTQHLSLH